MWSALWETTNAALSTLKQDGVEFASVVLQDTAQYLSKATGSQEKEEREPTLLKQTSSSQSILPRREQKRHDLQLDPATYLNDPDEMQEFEQWCQTFDLDEGKQAEISQLLLKSEIRGHYTKYVSSNKIPYRVFWSRYFFKMYQLDKKEERLKELVDKANKASEDTHEGWPDDDGWEGGGNWLPTEQKEEFPTSTTHISKPSSPGGASSEIAEEDNETATSESSISQSANVTQQPERVKRKPRSARAAPRDSSMSQVGNRSKKQVQSTEKVRHWRQAVTKKDLPTVSSSSSLGEWESVDHRQVAAVAAQRPSPDMASPSDPDSPEAESSSSDIVVLESVDGIVSSDSSEMPSRQSPPPDSEDTDTILNMAAKPQSSRLPVHPSSLAALSATNPKHVFSSGGESDFELVSEREALPDKLLKATQGQSVSSLSSTATPQATEDDDEWETWD